MAERLYQSTMRTQGSQREIMDSSNYHNLRLDPENPNYDPDLTENNKYFILSNNRLKDIKPTPENLIKIKSHIDNQLDNDLSKYFNSRNAESDISETEKKQLWMERAKLKAKFEKWNNNEKTSAIEKEIFEMAISDLNDKRISSDELLNKFEQITDIKISRRNDKLKALQKISDFDKIAELKNKNINRKIISMEILFKIPDDSNIKVSDEDWKTLVTTFIKDNFPNNKPLYIAIHNDENPDNPHPHVQLSGLNYKTKELDIPDQEIKSLRKWMLENEKIYPIEEKKWSEYSIEECKKHGELYQDYVFSFTNKKLNELGYDVNLQKRTPEEKAEADHDYQKKLRSTRREHNRQNKVAEIVEQAKIDGQKSINDINENIENLSINNQVLKSENENVKNENQELKAEQKEIIKKSSLIISLIDQLPKKVFNVIDKVKKYFSNNQDYSSRFEKNDAIEDLSNHIDKIENITDSKTGIDLVNNIIDVTENEQDKRQVLQEMNKTQPQIAKTKKAKSRSYGNSP